MENLEIYRKKIDELDSKIIELLEERMNISTYIGKYKKENDLPIQSIEREEYIMNSIYERLKNKGYEDSIKKIYMAIMNVSKMVQY